MHLSMFSALSNLRTHGLTVVVCAGLVLTEKWTTDNSLGTELTIDDQLLAGLKLSFDASFAPQTG